MDLEQVGISTKYGVPLPIYRVPCPECGSGLARKFTAPFAEKMLTVPCERCSRKKRFEGQRELKTKSGRR